MKIEDVLIIGSGVAALQLASFIRADFNVKILTKSLVRHSNSSLAQGGVAAAVGTDDVDSHATDTLKAGRYHNDERIVRDIVQEAPELVSPLSAIFDRNAQGDLQLGLEGAHSRHRILHSGGDATGKNLVDYLSSRLHSNVSIEENMFSYELMMDEDQSRCIGVKAKDSQGGIHCFYGQHIVLATGGCGQLYAYTSNASTATGDGIAMAYLAGAEIGDMEFIQFHPTLLHKNGSALGLISEAVRGEGAVLVTEDGRRVMEGVHPLKDLAPRHIVAQTVFSHIENGQSVYLDISRIGNFKERFPSISAMCEKHDVDLSTGRIPVAPGSHFLMGGIKTDLTGRTSVKGLYAIGEVACTGFHGANRLASNSLLEGLYLGRNLAGLINHAPETSLFQPFQQKFKHALYQPVELPDPRVLRNRMMKYVGIVRSKELLEQQKHWLDQFCLKKISSLDQYSANELTGIFMGVTASLITESALLRNESRGGHIRSDCPFEDDSVWAGRTLIHQIKAEKGIVYEYGKTSVIY
nr:L-aspartate oxidase [Jeotgalibacillus malaysiensis]